MKKLKNKKILGALGLIAVLAVGGAVYLKMHQTTPAPTEQQQLQKQEAATPPNPKTDNETAQRQKAAAAAAAAPAPTSAHIYISTLSQDDTHVYVSAIVDNQTSGTCTATFTSGSSKFTRTAPVGIITNYYACQGFTVAKADFPTRGDWNVKIDYANGSLKGSTDTQKITLN